MLSCAGDIYHALFLALCTGRSSVQPPKSIGGGAGSEWEWKDGLSDLQFPQFSPSKLTLSDEKHFS